MSEIASVQYPSRASSMAKTSRLWLVLEDLEMKAKISVL